MSPQSLITPTIEAATIERLRRNMLRLLQETGYKASCQHPPDGGPGCGAEIWIVRMTGGGLRLLDDQGDTHRCGETPGAKP